MHNTTISILKRAKELLVTQGWLQRRTTDGLRMCSDQALRVAAGRYYYYDQVPLYEARDLVLQAAREQTDGLWADVPSWNDFHGRTIEEVLDTFDHAIKLAERDQ